MCIKHICDKAHKTGIEDFGYGKGYIYLKEEFGRLLNLLEDVIASGIHVVITAHAKMRKFEQPDEMGAYDRWEMKLDKNVAPMVKEWADMVLFANYKVFTVKDEQTNKNKAQGGKRVVYTSHHPCWDAKNRHDLPPELPLDYSAIASYLKVASEGATPAPESPTPAPAQTVHSVPVQLENTSKFVPSAQENVVSSTPASLDAQTPAVENTRELPQITAADDLPFDSPTPPQSRDSPDYDGIPPALAGLMRSKEVAPLEIQKVVAQKGYFPKDMPVRDYPPDFVQGVLIAAWPKVWEVIEKNRKDDLPF